MSNISSTICSIANQKVKTMKSTNLPVAKTSWIFGELGKPILGPMSSYVLSQKLGVKTLSSLLGADLVSAPSKLPDPIWAEKNQENINSIVELLNKAETQVLSGLREGLIVDEDCRKKNLLSIPWSNDAVNGFLELGLSLNSGLEEIADFSWKEIEQASSWKILLEVLHNLNDYLPAAKKLDMFVPESIMLSDFVSFFEKFTEFRTGMDEKTYQSYRNILTRRNGWGVGKESLDEIGQGANVTRERIRQKEMRLERQYLLGNFYPAPALSQLLTRKYEPSLEDPDETIIWSQKKQEKWNIEGVKTLFLLYCGASTAAKFSNLVTLNPQQKKEFAEAIKVIQKSRSKLGVIRKSEVVSRLKPMSEQRILAYVKKAYPNVLVSGDFIDASTDYLDSFMYNMIVGQLAVNAPLKVEVLQEGIDRGSTIRQSKQYVPSVEALTYFLQNNPKFEVSSNGEVSYSGFFADDNTIVGWMVAELRKHPGQIATRAELIRSGFKKGFKISTISQYMTYGVEFRLGGQGTIHLVGSKFTENQFNDALLRAEKVDHKAEYLNFHQEVDGSFSVTLAISTAFMVSGVLAIPSSIGKAFGQSSRQVVCCPQYQADAHPRLSGKTLLANMASVRDHLMFVHKLNEGDYFHMHVSPKSIQLLLSSND